MLNGKCNKKNSIFNPSLMLAAYLGKYVDTKLKKDIVPKAPFNDEI